MDRFSNEIHGKLWFFMILNFTSIKKESHKADLPEKVHLMKKRSSLTIMYRM